MTSFERQWKKITATVEKKINNILVEASGRLYSEMVDLTPIKSGQLRRSWEIDYGQGYLQISNNFGAKFQAQTLGVNYTTGDDIWIRNQRPYAERIEFGYSKQAPAGMMRISNKRFQSFLDQAIKRNQF